MQAESHRHERMSPLRGRHRFITGGACDLSLGSQFLKLLDEPVEEKPVVKSQVLFDARRNLDCDIRVVGGIHVRSLNGLGDFPPEVLDPVHPALEGSKPL